jgi:hypothetical protein
MTEHAYIAADGFEHRTLATCRSCGDAVWHLDLEDTSTGADGRISFSCANCGARMAIAVPERESGPFGPCEGSRQ